MPLIIETYEATVCKSRDVVITFDEDGLRPVGELASAVIDSRGVLALTWADGLAVWLPDCRGKMAASITSAPELRVRWISDNLYRGSDMRQFSSDPLEVLST